MNEEINFCPSCGMQDLWHDEENTYSCGNCGRKFEIKEYKIETKLVSN